MNYMIRLLEESQAKFTKTDKGLYIISEKELSEALTSVYDKGMKWAYKLMMEDIKKHTRGCEDIYG